MCCFWATGRLLHKQPCYSSSRLKLRFIQAVSEWCLIAFCLPAYLLFSIRWPCYQCSFAWRTSKGGSEVIRAFLSCSQHDFPISAHLPCILQILARWNHCGPEKLFWSLLGWYTLKSLLLHVLVIQTLKYLSYFAHLNGPIDPVGMSERVSVCKILNLKWGWKV